MPESLVVHGIARELVSCSAYISDIWKVAIKKAVADLCLEIGMVYPFKLDTVDQVWPENFGGRNKAPAVDLVSGVYMGVQEEDE